MFDAFLKVEGIDFESMDEAHPKWCELESFQWRVDQPKSASASSVGSLSAERANFGDLVIQRAIDSGSPKLALACATGEHFSSAILHLCRAGGDKQTYMEYKLTDVMVTSFSAGGARSSAETVPTEAVTLNYGKIEWKYTQTKVAGGKGSGNVAAGWDLKTNKKV